MQGAKKKARHSGSCSTTLYASDSDSGQDALEMHGVSTLRALGKRPGDGSQPIAWRNDTEGSDDAICLSDGSGGEPDALATGDRDASLQGGARHVAGRRKQPTKMPDGRAKQGMRGNCTIHAICDVIVDQLLQEYDIVVDYNQAVMQLTTSCRAADGAYVLDVLSQINKDQNLLFMQPEESESQNLLYRLAVEHSKHLDFSRLYDHMKQPAGQMPRYALVAIKTEEDGHDLHLVSARGSFCKDLQKWVWAANSWGPNEPNLYISDQNYVYHVELSFTIVRVLKQVYNHGTGLGQNKPVRRNPPRNRRYQAAAEAQAHAVAAAEAAEMEKWSLKQELEEVKSKLLETESSNNTIKHEAEKDRARAGEAARECQALVKQLAELKSKLQAAESANSTIKHEAQKDRARAEEAARAHQKERQALEKDLAEQKSKLQAAESSKDRMEQEAEKRRSEIFDWRSAAEKRSKEIAGLQSASADELRQERTRRERTEELLAECKRRVKELERQKDLLEKQATCNTTGVRVNKPRDALLRSAGLGGAKDTHGQASGAGSSKEADDGADAVQAEGVVADALGRTYTCAECGKGKKAAASKCGHCCFVQPGPSGSSGSSALPEKKGRAARGAITTTDDGGGVCGAGAGQKMAAQDTEGRTNKIVIDAEAEATRYLEQKPDAKALDHPTGLRYYGRFDGDVCLHKNLNGEGWCINHGAACGGASEWFVLACYEGEFHNGRMHGQGTVTFKDGDIFAGTMHMDRPSSGVLTKADGSKSEVEFAGQAATCLGPDKPKPKRS